jgi:hypothetical protein
MSMRGTSMAHSRAAKGAEGIALAAIEMMREHGDTDGLIAVCATVFACSSDTEQVRFLSAVAKTMDAWGAEARDNQLAYLRGVLDDGGFAGARQLIKDLS